MENNLKLLGSELNKAVSSFENKNGDLIEFVLNENAPHLHIMKVKAELFKNLDLDQEFEQADLLDYLGYERIISCRRKNKL